MTRTHQPAFLLAPLVVAWLLLPASSAGDEGKLLDVEKTWDGAAKADRYKEIPKSGYVADKAAWAKLWKAFRDTDVPNIDFDKQLVLVAMVLGDTSISFRPTLDDKGDLKVSFKYRLERSSGTDHTYKFAVISRKGIVTVNGKPIGK